MGGNKYWGVSLLTADSGHETGLIHEDHVNVATVCIVCLAWSVQTSDDVIEVADLFNLLIEPSVRGQVRGVSMVFQ